MEFLGGTAFGMGGVNGGGRGQNGCGRGLWRAARAGRFRGGWAGKGARLGRRRAVMDARKLSELRAFVRLCKQNPGLLHTPELAFVREWVERWVRARSGAAGGEGEGRVVPGVVARGAVGEGACLLSACGRSRWGALLPAPRPSRPPLLFPPLPALPSPSLPAGIAPGALKRLVNFSFCFVNAGYSRCRKPAPRPSQWLSSPARKAPE